MSNHKVITLTGLDRVGKQTQTLLLGKALVPSTTMTYPNYGEHWAAELIRAALDQEEVVMKRTNGPELRFFPKKQPQIFQMWQSADRVDKQAWIKETLKTQHIIADRYEIDAIAYGLIDGCNELWLQAMSTLYYPSDYVFLLVGKPFPRPGEVPDLNERNPEFQRRVKDAYMGWSLQHPDQVTIIDVDEWRDVSAIGSMFVIHRLICQTLQAKLGIDVIPLDEDQIGEIFPALK